MICKVCNSHEGNEIIAKDTATGNPFSYNQCSVCGLIALNEIPDNYASYYSGDYYSFNSVAGISQKIKLLRDKYELLGNTLLGAIIAFLQPNHNLKSLRQLNLKKESTILDIGCGVGNEIRVLKQSGFNSVLGIDPFIRNEIYFNDELLVAKKDISSLEGRYDFITMHHSFEHVINPLEVLTKACGLLQDDGVLMIRIPIANSFAFEKYGSSWVQLDAPRHVFLHTPKSMEILCSKARLKIEKIIFDSTAFQFWGSNLVKNGNGIHSVGRWLVLKERIKSFFKGDHVLSKRLNKNLQGDQAIFIITKQNTTKG